MAQIGHKLYGVLVPYTYYENDTASGCVGIDGNDGDKLKLSASASLAVNPTTVAQLTIDPAANGNITIDPNGSGDLVVASGADVTVVAGNINMANANAGATQGIGNWGGSRFIHNYNGNAYLGTNAGNTTSTVLVVNEVGIGTNALSSITDGMTNTAVGAFSQSVNTIGSANVSVGISSLASYTGAAGTSADGGNTAVGAASMADGENAYFNSCFGYQSGQSLDGSYQNVIIGCTAGKSITSGSFNVIIGGTNSTANPPGNAAGSSYTTTESSNILIANVGVIGENNTIRIGTTGSGSRQQNRCFIAGITTVNVGSVATVVSHSGDQLGSTTITAGTGITVTPGANSITIANSAVGMVWSEVTGTSANMAVNNGYIANNGALVTLTLPDTAALGSVIEVVGKGAGGWRIAQNAGESIRWNEASVTTSGVTGYLESTDDHDYVKILCTTANTVWTVLASKGNITVA